MKTFHSLTPRNTCTVCYQRKLRILNKRHYSATKEIDSTSSKKNENEQIFSSKNSKEKKKISVDLFDADLNLARNTNNYSEIETTISKYYEPTWKFDKAPKNFWASKSNQRKFFDWLGERVGITNLDDWYNVGSSILKKFGGNTLLVKHFNGSLSAALRQVYPEHDWIPWKFDAVPRGLWNDPKQRISFFLWFEKELELQHKDDWYHVSVDTVGKKGGAGLMSHHFQNSMYRAMQSVFPEHNWIPWKFLQTPKNCWGDLRNLRILMEDAASKLHVQTLDDWYRVSVDQLRPLGVNSVLQKYKGLPNILKLLYPQHDWQLTKFGSGLKKSAQRWLKLKVLELFPEHEIHEDHVTELMFPNTNKPITLDVYIPSLRLAFEYQGEQHYQELSYFAPQRHYRLKDFEKRNSCEKAGMTLIEVPFWWDRSLESLSATIHQYRKDIVFSNLSVNPRSLSPIPINPPVATGKRPKSLLVDAIHWKEQVQQNPTGWWMSPSQDGVRALWDGRHLLSMAGKVIKAPISLLEHLPSDVQLDGELCIKKGDMVDLMQVIKSEKEEKWVGIEYRVHDIVSEKVVESRIEMLLKLSLPTTVKVVLPTKCEGLEHLKEYLKDSIASGNTSVLLKKSNSTIEHGNLFKVKVQQKGLLLMIKNFGEQQVTVVRFAPEQKGLLCKQYVMVNFSHWQEILESSAL